VEPVQNTSLLAFEEIRENLGERQEQVYFTIKKLGHATNSMIAKELNLPINSITPRTHELRNKKLVGFAFTSKCPITNRLAMFWKVLK